MHNLLSDRLLEKFSKYDRLEIHYEDFNEERFKCLEAYGLVLSTIRHPNLHVVLGKTFRVADAFQYDELTGEEYYCTHCHKWGSHWVKDHVEYLVWSIHDSTAKTVTYPLADKSKNVTFNRDENFDSTFWAFLDTQPIYIGRDDQNFTTLQMAKESFENGCKCYCTKHCHC